MVSGNSAEQPNPARANAQTPSTGVSLGRAAMSRNVAASTNGKTWYASWLGNQRWMAANSIRPAVTTAQNAVSASDATVAVTPKCSVRSSCDQFPFMVSQNPYSMAKPANTQNGAGIPVLLRLVLPPRRPCACGCALWGDV